MKQKSVKKNFAYQMIYEILIIIMPFLTSPYIARVIGAKGLGTFSYSYSIAYYFMLFSMLGLKNYGNRSIAQVRENKQELDKTFSSILAIHIIISLAVCFAYMGYVLFICEEKLYAIIQFACVVSSLFDISWFYFGIEEFKLTVTRNSIIKIVNVICVFLFVKNEQDLWIYCLIMALGTLIGQLVLWIPIKKYVKIVKPSWSRMKPHIKPMLILFIPSIAVNVYKYMDKVMIGFLGEKVQLGYYENAEKVINIPLTVITSFGTVMLPKMSNLAAKKKNNDTKKYINISMEFVNCLAFGLAFGMAGVGKVFAPVFWGREFTSSGFLIMGLAVTIPFISFANVIRTQFLIPQSRDKQFVFSVCLGAVINFVANMLLIIKLQAIGAMIGTILAEVSVCVVQTIFVRRELPIIKYIKNCITFFLMGFTMFVIVVVIGHYMGISITTLIVQILTGGVVYIVQCSVYFYASKNTVFLESINQIKEKLAFAANRKKG